MRDEERPMAEKGKLRSAGWFERQDMAGFVARGWLKNQGHPEQMFAGRPVIWIFWWGGGVPGLPRIPVRAAMAKSAWKGQRGRVFFVARGGG